MRQESTDVIPLETENIPASQPRQAVAPMSDEYSPGPHSEQEEAPGSEYVPLAQFMHVRPEEAPTEFENLPAGQRTQAALPLLIEYVPEGQS